jgi:CDGSH-type Zn-finger protein
MKIKLIENRPIILETEGLFSYSVAVTSDENKGSVALGRCGESSTKPFCDGAQRDAEFEGLAAELTDQ